MFSQDLYLLQHFLSAVLDTGGYNLVENSIPMKTAIMQPYFCAYIGYYQLINSVDKFVIFDNVQFVNRSWFNRNRIFWQGTDKLFTIPLKKDKSYQNVNEKYLADDSARERIKILGLIKNSYRNAPFFDENYEFIEGLFLYKETNLFDYIHHSVQEICSLLGVRTEIIKSSQININHELKAQDKVLELCRAIKTQTYINPPGGKSLYQKTAFENVNMKLKFLQPRALEYKQFNHPFIPCLSIIDVLMFNGTEKTKSLLHEYDLD